MFSNRTVNTTLSIAIYDAVSYRFQLPKLYFPGRIASKFNLRRLDFNNFLVLACPKSH